MKTAAFFLPTRFSPNSSSYSNFSSCQCSSAFGSASFFSSVYSTFGLVSHGFLKVAIAGTSPTNATLLKSLDQEIPPKTESLYTFEHSPDILTLWSKPPLSESTHTSSQMSFSPSFLMITLLVPHSEVDSTRRSLLSSLHTWLRGITLESVIR